MANKPWLNIVGATAIGIAAAVANQFEGVRLIAYQDVVGKWTICHGHTKGVNKGDTATMEQCAAYLIDDMGVADATVKQCITVALNVYQNAAFDDLAFNVGQSAVCGSTLANLANAGDLVGACHQLSRWVYAGKVRYQGLIRRRATDLDLCLTEAA